MIKLFESKGLLTFAKYVLWFTFYSLVGWGFEMLYFLALRGHFVERGFLHLPICPIYGFVAVFLILIFSKTKRRWWVVFFVSTAVLTVIEYITHYIMEKVFDTVWWYYNWNFSLNGRISLWSSLFFGILAVILIKFLHPAAVEITGKLPSFIVIPTGMVIAAAVTADFIYTCAENLCLI